MNAECASIRETLRSSPGSTPNLDHGLRAGGPFREPDDIESVEAA
jgi:hypothetical protein